MARVAAKQRRARAGADIDAFTRSLQDIFDTDSDEPVELSISVDLKVLRPLMIPRFKAAVEPFREAVRRRCSGVVLEVPTPALRAAVRGALYLFRPDVPVDVRAPDQDAH